MKTAASGRLAEPPGAVSVEAMKTIVQDEYGTAPEEVLRLAEVARPARTPTPAPA